MEQGELKIRVRSLELEKSLERIALAPPRARERPQPPRSPADMSRGVWTGSAGESWSGDRCGQTQIVLLS